MIGSGIDSLIGLFSPQRQLQRMQARRLIRSYQGAEPSRIAGNRKPKNQSADQESRGPFGADQLRAWARALVRDNAYAWGVVDTIVSSVVGNGIKAQSIVETPAGDDVESVNDKRDALFTEWCEVCDINGQLTLAEMQALAQREIVEAGEVMIRLIRTKNKEHRGIYRPVPLALELIEADRLSQEHDTFHSGLNRDNGNRIIRGVEVDEYGKAVAYWLYKEHPNSSYTYNREQERVPASEIIHLFRKDRVGQTRGVTWFAPVMSWLRDLGIYVDNEIQASAVASCFGVVVKSSSTPRGLSAGDDDTVDRNNNRLDYLEPALVSYLNPGEDIECVNPGRPNSASEPWIALMLRGISVGTGLSYEIVARDYSKVNYSSARTSQLEDRRRFRRWQQYLVLHLCQPIWDEFCNAAAIAGADGFPTANELLEARRSVAPVEWQTPEWEWVDPQNEQAAAKDAISSYMSTLSDELGARGRSWRATLYQSAKERKLREQLGLLTPEEQMTQVQAMQVSANQPQAIGDGSTNVAAQALNGAQVTSLVEVITQVGTGAMPKETAKPVLQAAFPAFSPELIDEIIDPIEPGSIAADGVPTAVDSPNAPPTGTGEMMGLSTLQWNRNRKAIGKILDELASGVTSPAAARVLLSSVGMSETNVEALIADATDGTVDTPLPDAESVSRSRYATARCDCNEAERGFCPTGEGGGIDNSCANEGGSGDGSSQSNSSQPTADEEISPGSIIPKNGVRNQEFLDTLVADMEANGWSGRPILALDNGDGSYTALTGSHRTMAAEIAGIDVPTVVIPSSFADEINIGDDDDGVLSNIKALAEKHTELKKAADLMSLDVNDETVNADTFTGGALK